MKPVKAVLWATIPKVGNRALTTRDLYDDRKKAKYDVDGTTLGNLLYRIARVEIREIAPKSRKR